MENLRVIGDRRFLEYPDEGKVEEIDIDGNVIDVHYDFNFDPAGMVAEINAVRYALRNALTNAIAVTKNSPYNTPEEQAIVDNTVELALADFRAIQEPNAEETKLALELLSWRI